MFLDPSSISIHRIRVLIAKFATRMREGKAPIIFGNGLQSRDFVFMSVAHTSFGITHKISLKDWFLPGTPHGVCDHFHRGLWLAAPRSTVAW